MSNLHKYKPIQYTNNQISVVSNCFEQSYGANPFIIFEDESNQY